jgi:hypothetical protein
MMKAQKHYDAATGKVADLESQLAEARDHVGEYVRLLEKVGSLKTQSGRCGRNRRGHEPR